MPVRQKALGSTDELNFSSSSPWTPPVHVTRQDILCDNDTLPNLKIEHPGTDKVGAVFVSVFEGIARIDGTRSHNLISDPGLVHILHEFDGFFRGPGPDIVVFGLPVGGPVLVAVEGFHIEIYACFRLLTFDGHLTAVTSDPCDGTVLLYELARLCQKVNPALFDASIGYTAVYIDPKGSDHVCRL